jgi:coatomer protein complex subunit gamma
LENELVSYVKDDSRHTTAFDISSIPKVSREQAAAEVAQARPSAIDTIAAASSSRSAEPSPLPRSASESQSSYAAQLASVPELSEYGPVLKSSSKPIELTESETEYVVSVVKHVFKSHVVFQFNVSNTIPDTVLEGVSVLMSPSPDSGLTEDFIIPIPALTPSNGSGQVYVSYTRDDSASYAAGGFGCTLRFVSKEVDPTSGEPEEEGYQDEYQVEDCDLGAGDVSAVSPMIKGSC